jgi:phosphatidylserine/phosphatidylglycerophosphate/cardiolipin synthase-like enzyme
MNWFLTATERGNPCSRLSRSAAPVSTTGNTVRCHSRNDDARHEGDPQAAAMARVYGTRPPWHDIQLAIQGPAVGQVEMVFRDRWDDPAPPSRNPLRRIRDESEGFERHPHRLPAQLPDPPRAGAQAVQVLCTYPQRRSKYPFAPYGERSVARGYCKAVGQARRLIYLEDQYLWSQEVVQCFATRLAETPQLRLIAVVPRFPDQDGRIGGVPQLVGRIDALRTLLAAGADRVAVYTLENAAGTPVYVHAKVCVIDDEWAAVGSDNCSVRSWTHDSELTCAVVDTDRSDIGFAGDLRRRLACEHLDRDADDDADLRDPEKAFEAFAESACRLQRWYEQGCRGARPAGRLLPYGAPTLSRWTRMWAQPLYRRVFDPDGRPRHLRRAHQF